MRIERYPKNPILAPNASQSWEAEAVFNGCPIKISSTIYLVYRAQSVPHYHANANTHMSISDIGVAQSNDGINFQCRRRFIVPEHAWERFGCEDPRITKIGSKYYTFYTALGEYPFRAEGIRVGLAISKNLTKIEKKHLITPFNAKGMALFSERIGGAFWAIVTVHTDMPPARVCLVSVRRESDLWSEKFWGAWYRNFHRHALALTRRPQDHVEVGTPPIKTKAGWLIFYSYIRDYFAGQAKFGIEAALLDRNDPRKILARTDAPLLAPDEYYERIGIVPNIVFPSGALLDRDDIRLYYGAADTTVCLATLKLSSLLRLMRRTPLQSVGLVRAKENPIIVPDQRHDWESKATFNPAALYVDGRVHIIYRAMSEDNTSVMGYAATRDGIHIDERLNMPIYEPRESFEQKSVPGGNSGCEDPRLVIVGKRVYMTYTAYDGKNPPRVALSSIALKDFLDHRWHWSKPVLISPPAIDDKDACIFPEKYCGKYIIVHRNGDDIDLGTHPTLDFSHDTWLEEYHWIAPRRGWWDGKKVGAASSPVKTSRGWIMLYHGVSDEGVYRVGAVLLDRNNPARIIGRTDHPILEPKEKYEKEGQIPNVVFPCGTVVIKDTLFVYYGGGDSVVGVATLPLKKLLDELEKTGCLGCENSGGHECPQCTILL